MWAGLTAIILAKPPIGNAIDTIDWGLAREGALCRPILPPVPRPPRAVEVLNEVMDAYIADVLKSATFMKSLSDTR